MADAPRSLYRSAVYRTMAATWVASVVGAVLSFVYNVVLAPLPPDVGSRSDLLARNLPWFVVCLNVCGLLLAFLIVALVRRAALTEDPVTRARRVIALPFSVAVPVGLCWVASAAAFVALNWDVGSGNRVACRIGIGITFAGAAATTLNYLLVDRALRPLFAEALPALPPGRRAGRIHDRLVVAWILGSAVPLLWIAAALLDQRPAERTDMTWPLLYLVATALVSGAAVHTAVTHSVSDPLDQVSAALRRVGAGDLDVRLPVIDRGELGELQAAVNAMTAGLRERRRIEDLFGRFVSPEVARHVIDSERGAERCEASVLFADVVASTALAEERTPEELLALLDDFFDAVVDVVTAAGGWVNGFDGDGAICVFGPPAGTPDHAARALRCARDLAARVADLRTKHPRLDVGIGVSTGWVVAGAVGAASRYEYTVIGCPVNEAARLTELAKTYDSRTLAGPTAVAAAGAEGSRWVPAGEVTLRGIARPVEAYEPAGAAERPLTAAAGARRSR
ncbi:MAG TPA: adenylate/guanylate cyclase domain-containing protein [Frankiaceae bacterium]|nr:adenylate/guanylate cyclase domain-containing protein [Frankiaceae bacterium]